MSPKEKQPVTQIHSEQWKVIADGYRDTFDSKEPANRTYGRISKKIKLEGEGKVLLQYRPESKDGKASEWIDLKEFILYDEDEDEDDEDDDDDDDDNDE